MLTGCNECNDVDIPFEGFDIAVVDQLKESLIGPDKRYKVEDVALNVNGENIVYGYYEKNDVYYFLVDYSKLENMDADAKFILSENQFIPVNFTINKNLTHCYPYNELTDLTIDGKKFEMKEQILVFK